MNLNINTQHQKDHSPLVPVQKDSVQKDSTLNTFFNEKININNNDNTKSIFSLVASNQRFTASKILDGLTMFSSL